METEEVDKSIEMKLVNAKCIIDQFINSCSHDLKNPLTSIEGLLMIAQHYSNHSEVDQCLELIDRCVTDMKKMIKNLGEYTTNLQRELNHDDIKADQLVGKVLSECDNEIQKDCISISTEIFQPYKWIADQHCQHLILKNLVANAIQFSDSNKKLRMVKVKVNVMSDNVKIEVSDNGIGISETDKAKVFNPFHKGSLQSRGKGLGLFLVKGLVEKLSASLSIHTAEQEGTSFHLLVPNHLVN